MIFIWLAIFIIVCLFGSVLLVGAPYLPTFKTSCREALKLLDLPKDKTLVDLGSGDGVMLVLAAQSGLKAVGYEINPLLVIVSKLRTWRYRKQVRVKWANFWQADLSYADGVFVFLLDKYMSRLDAKLQAELKKGTRVVSHGFAVPGKKSLKKTGALFLYSY